MAQLRRSQMLVALSEAFLVLLGAMLMAFVLLLVLRFTAPLIAL